jgi:drug/metabolite transporter (DMT)-like permease
MMGLCLGLVAVLVWGYYSIINEAVTHFMERKGVKQSSEKRCYEESVKGLEG